jgi:hypothetical protein
MKHFRLQAAKAQADEVLSIVVPDLRREIAGLACHELIGIPQLAAPAVSRLTQTNQQHRV